MTSDATSSPTHRRPATSSLASTAGSLAAYTEACVRCGQCATACHFYEVTGDPKYTPAYKLFPMAKAHKKHQVALALVGRSRR